MMVGLPRSGKSTAAKKLGFPIVSPDSIRVVVHGTPFRASIEPLIWSFAKMMVQSLFETGHNNVILDATNHTVERRVLWESEDWKVKYHVVNTPKDVCITRAIETFQDYLVPVINRMSVDFEPIGGKVDG